MTVRVQAKPPLNTTLGLSKASSGADLEVPFTPGTSLQSLFELLAVQYPGFKKLTAPTNNILKDIVIAIDQEVVTGRQLDEIKLQDHSVVTLLAMYKGG